MCIFEGQLSRRANLGRYSVVVGIGGKENLLRETSDLSEDAMLQMLHICDISSQYFKKRQGVPKMGTKPLKAIWASNGGFVEGLSGEVSRL